MNAAQLSIGDLHFSKRSIIKIAEKSARVGRLCFESLDSLYPEQGALLNPDDDAPTNVAVIKRIQELVSTVQFLFPVSRAHLHLPRIQTSRETVCCMKRKLRDAFVIELNNDRRQLREDAAYKDASTHR